MRRIPNFALLKTFEAAARLGSFALAALELHVTPSAVSHQVRKLEEYFSQALFVRQNRRVELTAEGRRLLESLSRVFDAIETACAEVALAPQTQVLALHCSPSLASKWLSPRLAGFMKAHPDIIIRLTSGAEHIDLTRARELDLVISYGSVRERAGIVSMALGTERIAPMCSPKLIDPAIPLRDLPCRLTLIDSQLSPVTWTDWFSVNGLALPHKARPSYDRASLAISAAADGLGAILESTRLAEREIQNGELVALDQDGFLPCYREIHFVSYRANEGQIPKIERFRNWLMQKSAE